MIKYSVVKTHNGSRGHANGAKEYTMAQAVQVAKRTHTYYQSRDLAAKIEIIAIKDNGQHGETVSEYYTIPLSFGK
jgi:hypothetical protein